MENVNRPLISVIVPVYNVERYLEQCVNSIIIQTYTNLEILLLDDGSKDSSGALCDKLALKDGRIKVIHKDNEGLGLTRDRGIDECKGKLISFVDSDDWIEKTLIETLYSSMVTSKVDFVKCGFEKVTDDKKVLFTKTFAQEYFAGQEARNKLAPRILGSSPVAHDNIEMCVWGCLYKADIIKENNIKFPSERKMISEDMPFNLEYLQYANGGLVVEYSGYRYRYNETSLTTSYRRDRFNATKIFFKTMHKKVSELGYGKDCQLRLDRMFFVYLRMCITQENRRISRLDKREALSNISVLCSDDYVKYTISSYPVNKLGKSQRLFLWLIKNKCSRTLLSLTEMGILKK